MSAYWAICWTLLAFAGVCQVQELCDNPSGKQLLSYKDKLGSEQKCLTLDGGQSVDSLDNSLSVGKHGPLLLQDVTLIQTLARFDRERIPERVVYAKGAGAHGYFEVTNDITKYTKAKIFEKIGNKIKIFVRFSLETPERGGSEVRRDPRGFAVKVYTEQGNWDILTRSIPVFPVRDPLRFPSYVHSQKRNPQTNLPDANMAWDFITLRPETTYHTLLLFSDLGIPNGYRHMDGYGIVTYKFVNKEKTPVYVRFQLKTDQKIESICPAKAAKLSGTEPDYFTRDLFNAIYKKEYPSWTLYIQVMTCEQAEKCEAHPFDATKIWPEEEYPFICVGKIVLDRNPVNYFAEVEQVAFNAANLISGIEPSPDRILQGQLFVYGDAQRYRLGTNYHQLLINLPRNKVTNINRDGEGIINNQGAAPNYYPNSYATYLEEPCAAISEFKVSGEVKRYDNKNEDNFSQAAMFWSKLSEEEKIRLVENLANSLKRACKDIQCRAVKLFGEVCKDLEEMLTEKLGVKPT